VARLLREGWVAMGGAKHDLFVHPDRRGVRIAVPRQREIQPGTARSIARAAGWLGDRTE
jgi:predicted RNA binding protein YcfA (HicA-like mRNA interferase family)